MLRLKVVQGEATRKQSEGLLWMMRCGTVNADADQGCVAEVKIWQREQSLLSKMMRRGKITGLSVQSGKNGAVSYDETDMLYDDDVAEGRYQDTQTDRVIKLRGYGSVVR